MLVIDFVPLTENNKFFRIMKRVGIITGIILAVLIAAIIITPIAFKGPLVKKIKEVINDNVEATVEFKDVKLSLFKSFPSVYAEIRELSVTGKDVFQNDTLVYVGTIATDLSLSELIKGKGYQIGSLIIKNGKVNLISNKNGTVNWDIVASDPNQTESESSESFSFSLNEMKIENVSLNYFDESTNTIANLLNTNMEASGKVKDNITNFDLTGKVDEVIVIYDSIKYISNTALSAKSQFEMNSESMVVTLGETTLMLNQLPLNFSGKIEMPADSIGLDLQFKMPQSDFATLLNMVPQSYQSYLKGVKTTGAAGVEGSITGWYSGENYPGIDIKMFVQNATFQYEGAAEKIDNINVDGKITKPQGSLDLLTVNIPKASAQVEGTPVNMKLNIATPVSDMTFDASLNGEINFTKLSKIIAMDSLEMKGILKGDMNVKGKMSDVEKQNYDNLIANGEITFDDFMMKTPDITQAIQINKGHVDITSKQITLTSLNAEIGKSDFQLSGNLSNYLPYFFRDRTLNGNFSLTSNYLSLDELSGLMVEKVDTLAAKPAVSDSIIAFQVPGNLNLTFRSKINRADFNKMNITDINGIIIVKDQQLVLQNLDMNLLDGKLTVDGSYKGNPENKPFFDFSVNADAFQIQTAYQSFSLVKRYLPIAAKSQGELSSKIRFKGQFDEKLELIPASLNGTGLLNTNGLKIADVSLLDQLKSVIKEEKLKNLNIKDIQASFTMENGNINMKPFNTQIADQDVSIQGSLSVDRTLDMALDFKVNRADLSADVNKMFGIIPGSSNIKVIDAGIQIKGDIKDPKISVDLSKVKKQIEDEVKKSAGEGVKNALDGLKNLFK